MQPFDDVWMDPLTRHMTKKGEVHRVGLEDCSAILMLPGMQDQYKHEVGRCEARQVGRQAICHNLHVFPAVGLCMCVSCGCV